MSRSKLPAGSGLFLGIAFLALAAVPSRAAEPTPKSSVASEKAGIASYYGREFDSLRTASGERFDMHGMTAAHPSLPFGTRLRVTNVHNGRQVVVRVNDRGPFVRGRILDLAYGAARKLGLIQRGWARVRFEIL